MVVKKQLRKISKKIMILGLATSIIFTSCFSTKKIEAHATSAAAGLGAYTLYQICLYIGGIVATTLGVGYVYDNRDDIAELGKGIIDEIHQFPAIGWILGSSTSSGDYVYGSEALREVSETEWTVIQGGGQSPKNDNDGDGDKDEDDIVAELNLNKMFLTSFGLTFFKNHIKELYDSWVQKDLNVFTEYLGEPDNSGFYGFVTNSAGDYIGSYSYTYGDESETVDFVCNNPVACFISKQSSGKYYFRVCTYDGSSWKKGTSAFVIVDNLDDLTFSLTNVPFHYSDNNDARTKFIQNKKHPVWTNLAKNYRIADWLADDEAWTGYLEDIATSLRSLQGLTNIAQELSENIMQNKPTVNIAGDTLNEFANYTYAPVTNVFITQPLYYPATNVTPKLDISVFPNYDIYIQNGGGAQPPDDGDGGDNSGDNNNSNFDLDLPTLSIMFELIYLMVMIVVMLLFVFLACLGFIVMIFRIPASSTMLPEDMVLGFEHLKTIMIPGFNISIFDFAMALIYLLIVFTVIKIIRLEINDYGIPKSRKGG